MDELLGSGPQGGPPRLLPCWYDFHAGRNPSPAGLHVRTSGISPDQVCYVTWLDVGVHDAIGSGQAVHRMQCAIHQATGVVEFRYDAMPTWCANGRGAGNPAVVGFSRGLVNGVMSVDPQSRDLSHELPFSTSIEGSVGNLGLQAVATPEAGGSIYNGRIYRGQTLAWNVCNIPVGSTIGVLILDVASSTPGWSIPGIHASGCIESTTSAALLHEFFLMPGSSVTGTVPLAAPSGYDPGLVGRQLHAQFALLDLSGNGPIVKAASNAIRHTFGLR